MKYNLAVTIASLFFWALSSPELLPHVLSQMAGLGHSWPVLSWPAWWGPDYVEKPRERKPASEWAWEEVKEKEKDA